MIRSKISRSFIVAIFIVTIIFLGYLDIKCITSSPVESVTVKLIKLGYIFAIIMLVLIYVYIKDKLYKIKMKRSHALIFRHIYISIAVALTNLLVLHRYLDEIGIMLIICFMILTIITSFIVKKVIFNVSKSDILAVMATFAFSMLPVVIENAYIYINALCVVMFGFATILNVQFLIDELKQKGIKTSKYKILSITLGIFMGTTCIMGVNYLVWCIASIALLVITINLDNTHINFPKKVMHSITQENREKLYGIERINISKLLICICIALIIMFAVYFIGNIIFNKISSITDNVLIQTIDKNIENNNNLKAGIIEISFKNILEYSKILLQFSKSYYMVLFVYIILIEILNILLKRRYDTKSTLLKCVFVSIYFTTIIFNINVYIMQPLFSMMLVLIATVNTSNIYLNREERVKMLVA